MAYLQRSVESKISDLLRELPALLLIGPRATGKTTTASRYASTIVRLDRPGVAEAFRADPDAALRGLDEPILLDEWQAAPEVLGAVKRAVDADHRPGRFLLTGSVRADLGAQTWPGTGRVVRIPMYGMTVAEQLGRPGTTPLLDRLDRGEEIGSPHEAPDLRGYIELALRSGFPEAALSLAENARRHWIEGYVEQLLTRDALQLAELRGPARIRRFFEAYALNSAGVVDEKTLYEAARIDRKTAVAYEQLLVDLMVAEVVPAWTSNRLKRLTLAPKRYVVDPALIAGVLNLDENAILRDGDLLGRFLDTFVVAQLRGELAVAESRPRLYHLRMEQGRHEVDVLAELGARRILGIEIKAASGPDTDDARHLIWLRDKLGDRFIAGLVLHTGPRIYRLDDRIVAAPIASLWA